MRRRSIDWHFPRAALAGAYLRMFLDVGAPSVVLFAPRGHGKTEFVLRDLIPAAKSEGVEAVYVNLWSDNTRPADTVCRALARAIGAHPGLTAKLKRAIDALHLEFGLELGGELALPAAGKGSAKGSVKAKLQPADPPPLPRDPLSLMRHLTEQLIEMHDGLVMFAFDEVQTLAAKAEHETFVRSLRTLLDTHKDRVCSVFTGSSQSKLADMFQRLKAPLYSFARNDRLPVLGDDFLGHWLANIQAIVGPDPGLTLDAMRTAFAATEHNPRVFWQAVNDMIMGNSTDIAKYTRSAVADVQANSGVVQRLRDLTPLDRVVLTEIVSWELRIQQGQAERGAPMRLFTQETRKRMAEALGITPTPQQVQTSLRRLSESDTQLVVSLDRGSYQIEDPLFLQALADILLRHAAPALSPVQLELAADEASLRGGKAGARKP